MAEHDTIGLKTGKKAGRLSVSRLVLALIYALFLAMGESMERKGGMNLFPGKPVLMLGVVALLTVLFYFILCLIDKLLSKQRPGADPGFWKKSLAWIWVPAILFLGLSVYLIFNLPGSVTYDGMWQLSQGLGLSKLYNHNPVLVTWAYGFLFKVGRFILHTDNAGVIAIALFQTAAMAAAFSWLIYEGFMMLRSKFFIFAAVVFYVAVPLFGGSAQVVLKDSFHVPFFIAMLSCMAGIIRKPSKLKMVLLCVLLILASLTRSMAMLYSLAGGVALAAAFLAKKREHRGFLAAMVAAAACFVLLWNNVLLPALDIGKYPSLEKYSLPLQQVAYVVVNHELTPEETAAIENVLDVETIREVYNPDISDPLKENFKYGDMGPFWKLYASWFFKYPADMVKSVFKSYYKYLDPYSLGRTNYRNYIQDCSGIGLNFYSMLPQQRQRLLDYVNTWESNPVLRLFMGPGLYSWILIYGLARGHRDHWPVFIPLLFLFIGLFLAAVNGETRYALPVIAAAPLIIAMAARSFFVF